jgi:hypothetical protein
MSKSKQNRNIVVNEDMPEHEQTNAITEEEISQRAYALYLARGGTEGSALDDWLQAERELRNERSVHA